MFFKLLTIILVVGGTAAALLVNRQQRIDTAHEMSVLHQRFIHHRRSLWRLRCEIAERCRPDMIRIAMDDIEPSWSPIPSEPDDVESTATQVVSCEEEHSGADADLGG